MTDPSSVAGYCEGWKQSHVMAEKKRLPRSPTATFEGRLCGLAMTEYGEPKAPKEGNRGEGQEEKGGDAEPVSSKQ
jgi:hypothetical protein